ncbi:hypothetical protein [Ferrimonas marina]|uniref:MSHA biogenesis protein MshF n=1 Tax=Ferrimonas marina TaxID=299255 RepID=A0A1M5Y0H4_9GAMM|nr:hypothetical protein [Ferrimonas marina]SHI05557.1 hypothetical protein SAMN02745129_3873 [Ferrimonas marina]
MRRPWLMLALTLLLVVVWLGRGWFLPQSPPVPPELVQQRLLDSLNEARGQWLMQGRSERIQWQGPDSQAGVLKMNRQGWPEPQSDCAGLWGRLMGQPGLALIQASEGSPSVCRFDLTGDGVLTYYPATGSLILG